MIKNILIYGQPGSGKTTLANIIAEQRPKTIVIDGDDVRKFSNNKNYGKQGRIENVLTAIMIAKLLNKNGYNVVFSIVCPYLELRYYLKCEFENMQSVFVHYDPATITRGRESFWANDFEHSQDYDLKLNTGSMSEKQAVTEINYYIYGENIASKV